MRSILTPTIPSFITGLPCPPLPILRDGITPVEPRPDIDIPPGHIPVATASLHRVEDVSRMIDTDIHTLVAQGNLAHIGDPADHLLCYVDLETAMRAIAIAQHGKAMNWSGEAIQNRIRTPAQDDLLLRLIVGDFMLDYQQAYGHHPNTIGYRTDPDAHLRRPLRRSHEGVSRLQSYINGQRNIYSTLTQ